MDGQVPLRNAARIPTILQSQSEDTVRQESRESSAPLDADDKRSSRGAVRGIAPLPNIGGVLEVA